MKILGLSAGRKMGNNEILVKEALMGAEEVGAEVGIIRLLELNIKPCLGCLSCIENMMEGGSGDCVINDDLHLLDEQIMESDGIILATPVFEMCPHGLIKDISDRMGPSHDTGFRMGAKEIRKARGITKVKGPDERSFKKRVAGFIAVSMDPMGGASLTLALMNLFTDSSMIIPVDQMAAGNIGRYGHLVANTELMARARQLGKNVAEAAKTPADQLKWMGDENGTCPVCHSNLLLVGTQNPVRCAICGINGELKIEGGKVNVTFSKEEQKKARRALESHIAHWKGLTGNVSRMPDKNSYAEKLKKYQGYKEIHLK